MCCLFRSSIHESTRRPSSSVKKGSVEITATQGVVWGSGQHQQRTMEGGAITTHSPLGVCLLTTHSASIAGGCSFIFFVFCDLPVFWFQFRFVRGPKRGFSFCALIFRIVVTVQCHTGHDPIPSLEAKKCHPRQIRDLNFWRQTRNLKDLPLFFDPKVK